MPEDAAQRPFVRVGATADETEPPVDGVLQQSFGHSHLYRGGEGIGAPTAVSFSNSIKGWAICEKTDGPANVHPHHATLSVSHSWSSSMEGSFRRVFRTDPVRSACGYR